MVLRLVLVGCLAGGGVLFGLSACSVQLKDDRVDADKLQKILVDLNDRLLKEEDALRDITKVILKEEKK